MVTLTWLIGRDERIPDPPPTFKTAWRRENLKDREGGDAILTDGEKHHIIIEAKRGSDFLNSYLSEHFQQQLTRMLATGLMVFIVIEGDPTAPTKQRMVRTVNNDLFTKAMATLAMTTAPNGSRPIVRWIPNGSYYTFLDHVAKQFERMDRLTDGVDPERVYLLGKIRSVSSPADAYYALLTTISGLTGGKARAIMSVYGSYRTLLHAWDECEPVPRPANKRNRLYLATDEDLLQEGRAAMLMEATKDSGRDKIGQALSRRAFEILWERPVARKRCIDEVI